MATTSITLVAAVAGAAGTLLQARLALRELGRVRREDVQTLQARDDLRKEVGFWRHPLRWRRWRAEINEAVTADERERLRDLEGQLTAWSLIATGVLVGLVAVVV